MGLANLSDVPQVELYHGHVLDVLAALPEESVQCVVTSPPYFHQRVYELDTPCVWGGKPECSHVWEELGGIKMRSGPDWAERRPQDKQSSAFGTVWYIPLGRRCSRCDAWEGHLGCEPTVELYVDHLVQVCAEVWRVLRKDGVFFLNLGDAYVDKGVVASARRVDSKTLPRPKDLLGIPWRVALALRERLGWYLRNDIIWYIPNGMPDSVRDRFVVDHEYLFMFSKSPSYFFDSVAVREPASLWQGDGEKGWRNRRTVWRIPYSFGSVRVTGHHAAFPEELAAICIAAGTSEMGACAKCGAPFYRTPDGNGWHPSCSCGDVTQKVPCVVLDPFSGTGTTCVVAARLGRRAIGIDLSLSYLKTTVERLKVSQVGSLLWQAERSNGHDFSGADTRVASRPHGGGNLL